MGVTLSVNGVENKCDFTVKGAGIKGVDKGYNLRVKVLGMVCQGCMEGIWSCDCYLRVWHDLSRVGKGCPLVKGGGKDVVLGSRVQGKCMELGSRV